MFDVVPQSGIRQGELALILKVSRVTVNNWLTGKHKPHALARPSVEKKMQLINTAVEENLLPLPGGLSPTARIHNLAQILKAIKDRPAPV
jgi:transcriptional regulator with XRE-family HTH domain